MEKGTRERASSPGNERIKYPVYERFYERKREGKKDSLGLGREEGRKAKGI